MKSPSGKADDFTVLMTACIAPKQGVREHLRRNDPALRERDYAAALRFWVQLDNPRITGVVFAENSGYSLDGLRHAVANIAVPRRQVEFLSFDFPAPNPCLSYGHTEFQLVRAALERSTLLSRSRYFIKATGRYRFPDINRLLRRLPRDFFVAVDSKGLRPFGLRSHPIAPVALALFERHYYVQHLLSLPERMVPAPPWNRRQFVEDMLFDLLYPQRSDPRLILRWPCNCEPVGIGANGDNYSSLPKRIQHGARAIARYVWPALWI